MDHLSARQRFLWRIREVLEDEDGCSLCPMLRRENRCEGKFYDSYRNSGKNFAKDAFYRRPYFCRTCLATVGLEITNDEWEWSCPCYTLGRNEAKKRAWLAIEEELMPKEG